MGQLLDSLRAFSAPLEPYGGWIVIVALVVFILYRLGFPYELLGIQLGRRRFGPAWKISTWRHDNSGNWLQQPVLSIAFETPQEYIAILQELAQRYGDPNGNISRNIERLHCVAQLRASGQTVESLPPDPASAPPEKLPIDRPFQNSNDAAHFDAPDPQSPNSPRLPLLGRPPSPPAPPTLQTLPPQQGIVLKIKRSQRLGPLGGNIYMLDARIDASAEIRAIILKHRLGNRVIYESRSRKKRAEATLAHLEKSQESTSGFPPPSAPLQGTGGALLHLGRAAVSAGIGAFSLHVTIDKLFSGIHIECKSMEELLDAEQAVKQAKENLLKCIDLISTFDGREEII